MSEFGSHRAYRSLFWKYFAAIGGSVLLVLPATATAWAWLTFRDHRATVERLQQEQARAAADKIGEFIRLIETQLAWTVVLPWNASSAEERRLDGLRLMRQVPAIAELALLDDKGGEQLRMSRLAVDAVGSGIDRSGEPLFRLAREHSVFRGPVYFHRESEPHMVISVAGPRTGSGVGLATVNLKLIWDVVLRINAGDSGVAYVVDGTGRLIAHPDQSLVLKGTNFERLPQVSRALSAGRSRQSDHLDIDESGRRVLAANASIADTGWIVLVQAPISVALAPIYSSLLATVVIMLAALALALVSSLFLARRMFSPIHALEVGAGRIGAGVLEHRIEISTGDELQRLADSFNSMAGKLQQAYATLETKVADRTRQLEEANLAKSRFLAAASHDLRQPLHALGLFAEQLRASSSESERAKVEARLRAAIAAMDELFGSLLDVSRLDAGVVVPDQKSFPVAHLMDRIAANFSGPAVAKGLGLLIVETDCWIRSDPILLERILNNLVSNAVRYTKQGRILVGCRRRGNGLRIEVWDTGPGIPVEQHKLVFNEFYRGTSGGPGAGLGLGLSIVDRLSRLLEHPLELSSRPNAGTRFALTVPRTNRGTWLGVDAAAQPQSLDVLRGKRIVVIDDDPLSLHSVVSVLQSWGCRVISGAIPDDVLGCIDDTGADAIIADYHLANGQLGTEAIKAVRSRAGRKLPALLVSGDTDPHVMATAKRSGYLMLHKPVEPMALRAGLSRLLEPRKPVSVTVGEVQD